MSTRTPQVHLSLLALAAPLLLAVLSGMAYTTSRGDLPAATLRNGRIVLASGQRRHPSQDRAMDGATAHIIDGSYERPALFTARPGQKPYMLIDLALSHWPPHGQNARPRARRPLKLIIYNGPCTRCPVSRFRRYARARTIEVQFFRRRANNPDAEYRHMPTLLVKRYRLQLQDRRGPQEIPLKLPAAWPSRGYPHNVFYYVARVNIEDIYSGSRFATTVAMAEIIYADADAALQGTGRLHLWQ